MAKYAKLDSELQRFLQQHDPDGRHASGMMIGGAGDKETLVHTLLAT